MSNAFRVAMLVAGACVVLLLSGTASGQQQADPAVQAEPNAVSDSNGVVAGTADEEIETEFEKWVGKLRDAGATIPVLLFLSIVAVALILERLWTVRRKNFVPPRLVARVNKLWVQGDFDQIARLCGLQSNTFAQVVRFIVKHRGGAVADVSATAGDIAARDLRRHLLRAYPLAIIATVSPLLGLLGTVSGMVGAFDTVAMMGELGDAGALGGDISKALVTTLVGLVVAIPSLFAYHYFKSRTQYFGVVLEEEITTLISERLMKKGATHADQTSRG